MEIKLSKEEQLQFENIALKRSNIQLENHALLSRSNELKRLDTEQSELWNNHAEILAKKHNKKNEEIEKIDYEKGLIIFKNKNG